MNKAETAEKYGEDQVKIWRRSFDITPPALPEDDERSPRSQEAYRTVKDKSVLPLTESLATTIERAVPYFESEIKPHMQKGERVLIVAHGNSLRALVKYFENLTKEEILEVNIPTGVPLVYEFDDNFKVIGKKYLGDEKAIAEKMAGVANQGKKQ